MEVSFPLPLGRGEGEGERAIMMKPYLGFWERLARPIIGLAPMDGITALVCRVIVASHGRPDVLFTEFVHVQGLQYAPQRLFQSLDYTELERPIVAQVYGHRPEDFYIAAFIVCELGFDGIDINMGCPAKKVTRRHGGAQLITLPEIALEIIRTVRRAMGDWVGGKNLEDLNVRPKLIHAVREGQRQHALIPRPKDRRPLPYSVKTRLGYDTVTIESWIKTLLTESPATISIHGRTLKQMYKGQADWEAIGQAAKIAQGSGTLILGNGDITSLQQASDLIQKSGVDGVLVGRGAIGNPWIFQNKAILRQVVNNHKNEDVPPPQISLEERFRLIMEHARLLEEVRGPRQYNSIKKHLVHYLSHFPNAAPLRAQAVQTKNVEELRTLLERVVS